MPTAQDVLAKLAALAGEDEAVLGSNNTTVNQYFNAPGQPYCGYAIWYAVKTAGSDILDGCQNPAYVPTLKSYLAAKGWTVSNDQPQAGYIFAYKNDHVGFVYAPMSGSTALTLEGNSTVYKTTACTGAAYEGIGYKTRTFGSDYTLYRPAYDGASAAGTEKTGPAVTVSLNLLQQGHTGPQVKTVQRLLTAAGVAKLDIDGQYGPATAAAVRTAQQRLFPDTSSEWDGQVGEKTWTALLRAMP